MNQLDHPFILKLNGVAQDKRIVYMYTDYLPSGDLMGILNEFDKALKSARPIFIEESFKS